MELVDNGGGAHRYEFYLIDLKPVPGIQSVYWLMTGRGGTLHHI